MFWLHTDRPVTPYFPETLLAMAGFAENFRAGRTEPSGPAGHVTRSRGSQVVVSGRVLLVLHGL